MARIRIKNLYKKFAKTTAVDHINISCLGRRVYGFVGTLRLRENNYTSNDTGLEVPTSRKVFLDNKLMNNIP
ncbi:hypothetical protein DRJ00_08535 [Candidatus Aerophobetes bacterium]|uniref:ABC transporter ATP-binding protein n=1 Tax=Aerophobetes bacterium TaxID=2030807 RepID=A0A497E1I4_UNCAE|nr:MAG: hypothetical protein DRJ00_08535 [Candidatus Aerophobetes bacterium]RLE15149.1 MAG: hypothetical protein DRJ04_00970 [Candidatus Aerophobetes bacterium]